MDKKPVKWSATLARDVPDGLRQKIANILMKLAEKIDGKRKYHAFFIDSSPRLSNSDYNECFEFGCKKAFEMVLKLAQNESCEQVGIEIMPRMFDRAVANAKDQCLVKTKDRNLIK